MKLLRVLTLRQFNCCWKITSHYYKQWHLPNRYSPSRRISRFHGLNLDVKIYAAGIRIAAENGAALIPKLLLQLQLQLPPVGTTGGDGGVRAIIACQPESVPPAVRLHVVVSSSPGFALQDRRTPAGRPVDASLS